MPKSVAVVGASRDTATISGKILQNIIKGGFAGNIYPVNPRADELAGLKCYSSYSQIPDKVDLAVVAVPVEKVQSVFEEFVGRPPGAAVVISAGFAERSPAGAARQDMILDLARRGGIRVVGPNCLGLINTAPEVSLNAVFARGAALPGTVAVAAQSGAFGLLLFDFLQREEIGISSFFSIGNRVDISSNDLLEYWEKDDRTKVIALHLQSLGNPDKFLDIASRISRTKPIVALMAGRSKSGADAAASHSAAVGGDSRSIQALLTKAGIIQPRSLEELVDVVKFLHRSPLPKGPRVGIVTNGIWPAIMLVDSIESNGLEVPVFSTATKEALALTVGEEADVSNPYDLLPQAGASDYRGALKAISQDESIDSVIVMNIPVDTGAAREIAQALPDIKTQSKISKPLVSVVMSTNDLGRSSLIPNYQLPEGAAVALGHAYRYSQWKSRTEEAKFTFTPDQVATLRTLCRAGRDGCNDEGWMSYAAAEALLCMAGIAFPASAMIERNAYLPETGQLEFPLIAKLLSSKLVHKADIGGVIGGINSPAGLKDALRNLETAAAGAKISEYSFLVQEQLDNTVEGFIGGTRDPECGPVVVLGFGGNYVQLFDDIAALIPPFGPKEVRTALSGLRFNSILEGYRGEREADVSAYVDAAIRIGALLVAVPEIAELDLNPVLVARGGGGVSAADMRIRLHSETRRK